MLDPRQSITEFVEAYGVGDGTAMRALLADELVAYVTNAQAEVDRVDGADAYLERLPELASASASARITQTVSVAPDQALTMIEINAARAGRELHNFGAFLSRIDRDDRICELWMVDALPSYSDEFWS